MNVNDYRPALAWLDQLLDSYIPKNWILAAKEAFLLRSELYQRLDEPTRALENLNMVLQVDPSDPKALLARGKLQQARLQGILAKDDFEHACLLGSVEACRQLP
ncbi:MAG: hypothetical protein ICV75_04110 [Nitrospiraceae bacterium]|nr:hypothetical protein [Nitrospiraceae bacterium]